jgi:hypothetical protein
MRNKVLLVSSVVTLFLGTCYFVNKVLPELQGAGGGQESRNQIGSTEATLHALIAQQEREIESLRAEVKRLSAIAATRTVTIAPTSASPPLASEDQSAKEKLESRMATWRARQFVNDVEENLALTPEQKEALTQKFEEQVGSHGASSDAARGQIIAQVLGDEVAKKYEHDQQESLEREQSDQLNSEAIVLARKLSLTPDQEQRVHDVLSEIDKLQQAKAEMVRLTMREAMANHLGGDEAKDMLKQQYDTIKQLNTEMKAEKDKLLFDQLSGVLSDEQKNALLALQAAQRN